VCGSSARTDLYGGQLAIAVPTVTRTITYTFMAHRCSSCLSPLYPRRGELAPKVRKIRFTSFHAYQSWFGSVFATIATIVVVLLGAVLVFEGRPFRTVFVLRI
jgi:hypothetical protein